MDNAEKIYLEHEKIGFPPNDTRLKFPQLDSQWVEKAKGPSKYELKVQERGGLVHIEFFENYDEVINYFVNWMYKTYD